MHKIRRQDDNKPAHGRPGCLDALPLCAGIALPDRGALHLRRLRRLRNPSTAPALCVYEAEIEDRTLTPLARLTFKFLSALAEDRAGITNLLRSVRASMLREFRCIDLCRIVYVPERGGRWECRVEWLGRRRLRPRFGHQLAKDRKSGHYYRATFQELSSPTPRSCSTHRTSFNRTDQKLAAVIYLHTPSIQALSHAHRRRRGTSRRASWGNGGQRLPPQVIVLRRSAP
jgi:hypothetical protein